MCTFIKLSRELFTRCTSISDLVRRQKFLKRTLSFAVEEKFGDLHTGSTMDTLHSDVSSNNDVQCPNCINSTRSCKCTLNSTGIGVGTQKIGNVKMKLNNGGEADRFVRDGHFPNFDKKNGCKKYLN